MKAKRLRGEFHVSAIEVAKGDLLWHYTESDTDIAEGVFGHYAAVEIELLEHCYNSSIAKPGVYGEVDWARIEDHVENIDALVKARRELLAGTFDKMQGLGDELNCPAY